MSENNNVEWIDMDLDGAKPHDGSRGPRVPAGDYHVRVDSVEQGQSRQNKPKITVRYEIVKALDEENEAMTGEVFPASYSIDPDNDFAKQRMANLLLALGLKATKRGIPAGKFPGKEILLSVEHRESQTRDPMTDEPKTNVFQNVCRERPLGTGADDDDDGDDGEAEERPQRRRKRKASAEV